MDKKQDVDIDKLQFASTRSRIKVFVIDDLSITLIVILMLWDKIDAANGDLLAISAVMNSAFFQIVVLKFLYQAFFVWYYGATLGKLAAKIKVIDYYNFGRVSLLNSIIRSAGRIVSEMAMFIGFLFAFFTDSRQTFHDKIGKTLVVDA
jgi:uncharacterized RDD family membrane protein YckC